MKINCVVILMILNLFLSCNKAYRTQQKVSNNTEDKELYTKIKGEWAISVPWVDNNLTFKNKNDKNFEQETFPTFNTIIFNKKNKTIEQKTYGEFGCGSAMMNNLEINNSKWYFDENGNLHLSFQYSDYSGDHVLDNIYHVERKEQILTLKKIK